MNRIASKLSLTRHEGEDSDMLASRCHFEIDSRIRQHAEQVGAHEILQLMDMHEQIARLVP